jgi:hypothetical protein
MLVARIVSSSQDRHKRKSGWHPRAQGDNGSFVCDPRLSADATPDFLLDPSLAIRVNSDKAALTVVDQGPKPEILGYAQGKQTNNQDSCHAGNEHFLLPWQMP